MSNRGLGYAVLLLWLNAAVSVDHLFGMQGLMSRHHASFLDPWLAILNAVIGPLLAITSTYLWWHRRSDSRAADR